MKVRSSSSSSRSSICALRNNNNGRGSLVVSGVGGGGEAAVSDQVKSWRRRICCANDTGEDTDRPMPRRRVLVRCGSPIANWICWANTWLLTLASFCRPQYCCNITRRSTTNCVSCPCHPNLPVRRIDNRDYLIFSLVQNNVRDGRERSHLQEPIVWHTVDNVNILVFKHHLRLAALYAEWLERIIFKEFRQLINFSTRLDASRCI